MESKGGDVMMGICNSDWAYVPRNVLHSILDKLFPLSEYALFAGVCKSWLSVAIENYNQLRLQRRYVFGGSDLPMLMIPTADYDCGKRNLYSFMTDEVCDFQLTVPHSVRATGCSNGWIATWNKDMVITLSNPLLNRSICLPPILESVIDEYRFEFHHHSLYPYCIGKVAISALSPTYLTHYVVAAIYGNNDFVAYIRSGDDHWTSAATRLAAVTDIVFYKGHLLTVDLDHAVACIDVWRDSLGPPLSNLVFVTGLSEPGQPAEWSKPYIVESSCGDILLCKRCYSDGKTIKFEVFRLIPDPIEGPHCVTFINEEDEWVEIHSIDDCAVFLGDNQSTCIKASSVPGCKPNCIYFTDDDTGADFSHRRPPVDIGIFNMDNGSVGRHYMPDSSKWDVPRPFWAFLTFPVFDCKADMR